MNFGFRKLEAVVVVLVATIAVCFGLDLFLAKPDWGAVAMGTVVPSLPGGLKGEALIISLGILGATVMPHNLYLHSSIVQTRDIERTPEGLKSAVKNNIGDTVLALSAAFFVNAAILILAAAVFGASGRVVTELQNAHQLLKPALGGIAATLFAVALLASGQSSTITGTLAGQIVMEGFTHFRIAPWKRRLITRVLAIIPTMIIISATGGRGTVEMLVISQVILSMQLSFAIFPLIMFTSDKAKMGEFANKLWVTVTGYVVCSAIGALNLYLLWQTFHEKVIYGDLILSGIAIAGLGFAGWVIFGYKSEANPHPVRS
jgi:manganese transport protein